MIVHIFRQPERQNKQTDLLNDNEVRRLIIYRKRAVVRRLPRRAFGTARNDSVFLVGKNAYFATSCKIEFYFNQALSLSWSSIFIK